MTGRRNKFVNSPFNLLKNFFNKITNDVQSANIMIEQNSNVNNILIEQKVETKNERKREILFRQSACIKVVLTSSQISNQPICVTEAVYIAST